MATQSNTTQQLQEAIDAVYSFKMISKAADSLALAPSTLRSRHSKAVNLGMRPSPGLVDELEQNTATQLEEARAKIRGLEASAASRSKEDLNERYVKRVILNLAEQEPNPPNWLTKVNKKKSFAGVPTLFASDWHWGEVVDPGQINNVNKYDIEIAQVRARTMIEKSIDLLRNHISNADYPGIVFMLGGDMVSGDIHEELVATNQKEIMPVVLDLFGVLVWCINRLADEFGNVFVPCVSGNHGRNTHKIRAKGRNFTSFDWLLYQFLAKHFEADKRIKFMIPDGPDAYFSIFGHRYLLTHGDQFRGGDGVIGALGPIIRGDHRKRSRNGQIDMSYETLCMGHFHQLISLERLIVNGSLKGMDEYAYSSNFGFEPPRQALWITHPNHGITFSMPVIVDPEYVPKNANQEWVTWKE